MRTLGPNHHCFNASEEHVCGAAQSKCPIYVNKTVWANSATTVERLLSGSAEPDDEDETTSTRALTTIRCETDVR